MDATTIFYACLRITSNRLIETFTFFLPLRKKWSDLIWRGSVLSQELFQPPLHIKNDCRRTHMNTQLLLAVFYTHALALYFFLTHLYCDQQGTHPQHKIILNLSSFTHALIITCTQYSVTAVHSLHWPKTIFGTFMLWISRVRIQKK